MLNKILVINKDKGVTSREVVNKLSKILGIKKIGHTGTLDPIATGVLVCLTGKYTKLVDMITSLEKEYIATIKLGIKTDTLDITGSVLEENYNYEINKEQIVQVLNSFIGEKEQIVPIYSAVHIHGKRLYEYARENKQVELPKRIVYIKEIELLNYQDDLIKFRVVVSKGTYIRSLIKDICDTLNVLGTMDELVRTKQGLFTIENAYNLKNISDNEYQSLKLEDVLDLKMVALDKDLEKKVLNGNKLELNYDGYILFKKDDIDVALYYFEKNIGTLKILMNN
ncbi:MAG: tRNA pseudouridine(55) synthase TruB [Firmicutes bacterium]|nr:tRNA pseudouridine(55) synthase TruB [Bacillota bacterium]